MAKESRSRRGKKLLVASVGVATVSFVGVGCGGFGVANLMAPPSCEVAPQQVWCQTDAGPDVHPDAGRGDDAADAAADSATDVAADGARDSAQGGDGEGADAGDGPRTDGA